MQDTLVHLTTGTMLPLAHATVNNLQCSEELWQKYYHNPNLDTKDIPSVSIEKLHSIHPEEPHPSKLSHRNRFNAWKYRMDLVNYGPEYFCRFRSKLGDPEVVEQIPIPEEVWIEVIIFHSWQMAVLIYYRVRLDWASVRSLGFLFWDVLLSSLLSYCQFYHFWGNIMLELLFMVWLYWRLIQQEPYSPIIFWKAPETHYKADYGAINIFT